MYNDYYESYACEIQSDEYAAYQDLSLYEDEDECRE